uniref:hypothetical protein n=1 Tax=Desulfobacula toluolica TaxID=28223 RepID=UPI0002FE4D3D
MHFPFNQTSVELKHVKAKLNERGKASFNQTSVELKHKLLIKLESLNMILRQKGRWPRSHI